MEQLAKAYGLDAQVAVIRQHALPAIALVAAEAGSSRSRLGGSPLLPQGFEWPTYVPKPPEDMPPMLLDMLSKMAGGAVLKQETSTGPRALDFLLQIDLGELRGFECASALPSSGLLTFFYDIENQPWGFDPNHLGGSRVILVEDESLTETPSPNDDAEPLRSTALSFRSAMTAPHYGSFAYEMLERDAGELPEDYVELCTELEDQAYPSGLELQRHRLLGHSANIQNDMQLEAQLVTNGLYCGDGTGYNDPRAQALKQGVSDWTLLLQLDSVDDSTMWGDAGMLYFWIRKQDLAARRFDRCWMTLQCG